MELSYTEMYKLKSDSLDNISSEDIKIINKEQEFINQQNKLGQLKNDLIHDINILK